MAVDPSLRFAFRYLARRPGFAIVALVTLALGLGATTAVFSLVYGVVLRPLDLPAPERVAMVFEDWRARSGVEQEVTGVSTLRDWQAGSRAFASLAGSLNNEEQRASVVSDGSAEALLVNAVTRDYFAVLGVAPSRGRVFTAEEEVAGKDGVLVVSHGFWQRALGGRHDALGRQVVVNSRPRTLVGVLPPGFRDPLSPAAEAWLPLALEAGEDDRGGNYVRVVGRLRPGATRERAAGELNAVMNGLAARFPERYAELGVTVVPLQDVVVQSVERPALALFGAVVLVLLIACVNLANLLLARASEREREMALRTAVGAGRWRLVRQLLGESLLLAALGGAAGMLVGWGLLRLLVRLAPANTPRLGDVGLDPTVFAFALVATLLVGLLFGLLPAWKASRVSLSGALRHGGRALGGGGLTLRRALIVGEVALSLALLVGAGLFGRTLLALGAVAPGFATDRLLAATLVLSEARYPEAADVRARLAEIEQRLRRQPGIEAVGVSSVLPLTDIYTDAPFAVEGLPPPPESAAAVQYHTVTPGLFATLAIPRRAGRLFDERDAPDAAKTLIVNDAFVRQHLPGLEPLGRNVRLGGSPEAPWRRIVGVVGSVRHGGLGREPEPQVYLPHAQASSRGVQLVLRAAGQPEGLVPVVQSLLRELDPELATLQVRTGEQILGTQLAMPRFLVLLVGSFAAVAMALAAVGIYGVMSFLVAQRRREIGLRLALGARPRAVLAMVVRQGVTMTAAGIALGTLAALLLTRGIGSLLYAVAPSDPWTLAGAAAALLLAALAACLVPALAASRVPPAATLRGE
jgi:putative ABC transport system permease protein